MKLLLIFQYFFLSMLCGFFYAASLGILDSNLGLAFGAGIVGAIVGLIVGIPLFFFVPDLIFARLKIVVSCAIHIVLLYMTYILLNLIDNYWIDDWLWPILLCIFISNYITLIYVGFTTPKSSAD